MEIIAKAGAELPLIGFDVRRQCLSSRHLHLTILPTEQCNFRCVYCYEDFALPRMARSVICGIKALLDARASNLDRLWIAWFGGEPLMAPKVVEEIQGFAQELACEHGIDLQATMTTNGALLDASRFNRLVELGVQRYQISLDGPRAMHDRKRIQANGRGTFDAIWGNLEAFHTTNLDAEILLRIHVDRENRAVLPAFLEDLAAAFGSDARFKVFLRPLSRLGGPNDDELPILEADELRVVAELRQRAEKLGFALHGSSAAPVCYAAAANAFVIRANGDVAKCTVALRDPRNRVGRLQQDGRLVVDSHKMMPWIGGLFTGDAGALACPLQHLA